MRSARLRSLAVVTAAAAVLLVGSVSAGSASTTAPSCGLTWGSLPTQAAQPARAPGTLVNVRAGQHACYDRLVLDVDGHAYDYWVQYVDQVRADASGTIVPLAGGARLHVGVGSSSYDQDAVPTYEPGDPSQLVDVSGFRTFRQVAWGGSVETRTTIGLGVRARLPFRVFALQGPGSRSRIMVDVAHRW